MGAFTTSQDIASQFHALANRVATLERVPAVIVGNGPPSSLARGTLYLDESAGRVWANTSAGLRSALLT